MSGFPKKQETDHLGYWGYSLAIILSCLIVAGLAYSQGVENERRDKSPYYHAESAKTRAKSRCTGINFDAVFECVYEAVETSSETARSEQDLDAQQQMAMWAFLMAIISTITVIVTALGIVFVKRTLDATLSAVSVTRDGLVPYVHPTMAKIVEPLSEPLEADIVFENGGNTPALETEFYSYLTGEDEGSTESYESVPKDKAEPVGPIPPKSKRQRRMTLDKPGDAIKAFKQLREENSPDPKLVLRGFVRYSDTFGNRYVTEFAYATGKLPLSGDAVKMKPIHMTAPTYQKI